MRCGPWRRSRAGSAPSIDGDRGSRSATCPETESGLEDGPRALAELAAGLGLEHGLVVPVVAGDEVLGSLELIDQDELDDVAAAAARLAAAQVALAIRAYGGSAQPQRERAATRCCARPGEGLAAGADAEHAEGRVLRLGLELTGAEGAVLWRLEGDGRAERGAAVGRTEGLVEPPAVGVEEAGGRATITNTLGEPAFGLLQLVFPPGFVPAPGLVELLGQFAIRAAQPLRAADDTRVVASELEQTRAVLTVVAQANRELSLAHALDTAVDRVAELVGATRLAVYLLEDSRLAAAAERGLAGPARAAWPSELLELATRAVPGTRVRRRRGRLRRRAAWLALRTRSPKPGSRRPSRSARRGRRHDRPARRVPGARPPAHHERVGAARSARGAARRRGAERAAARAGDAARGRARAALAAERASARQLGAQYEISKAFAESLRST